MSVLPSPQTTLVILLGASQHPLYRALDSKFGDPEAWEKAFKQAVKELREYLENHFKLPTENLLNLFDTPEEPQYIFGAIQEHLEKFIDKATDLIDRKSVV